MQSSTTKGKLIALPPSHIRQSEKEQGEREERRREGGRCNVVRGPLAFLLSTWHWQLTLTQCPRWAGDMAQEAETPRRQTLCVFVLFSVSFCGRSWVDSKCHSSVTHVDDFDPVTPRPCLSLTAQSKSLEKKKENNVASELIDIV